MTTNTKEFHDMRKQFENSISNMPVFFSGKVEREVITESTPKNVWYTNGVINAMFISYMTGYQLGRNVYMTV